MEMANLEGVITVKGDITAQSTVDSILTKLNGQKAQLVVSDGAPDVLGLHDFDEYIQAQLVLAALNISLEVLEIGGTFVAKIFRGREISLLFAQLSRYFETVVCAKPQTSRNSSFEAFVVCQKFRGNIDENIDNEKNGLDTRILLDDIYTKENTMGTEQVTVPFIACKGTHDYDADQSYPTNIEEGYVSHAVLQRPINPPYAHSITKAGHQ